MKVLLYCMVFATLRLYSIETKGRRFKSCRKWKEICIKKQLHHFEKRYKSKTDCLEKHGPEFHSNGSLLKEYYTIANRKSCESKGVVQVPRKCVKYAKENLRDGLLHVLVNQTCWSSAFRSYHKKKLKLTFKADMVCSSQKKIRHTKCGKFRHGDDRNSVEKDDKSTLVSISTPNYTIIKALVPNSTTTTSLIDLDNLNHLDDKNNSTASAELGMEEGRLSAIIGFALVSLLLLLMIGITLMKYRRERKRRLSTLTLKSREDYKKRIDFEMNIQSCTVTDKRASLGNTSLSSDTSIRFDSSGSTVSTHIRLGDTSHLFTDEGRENGQTQIEEEEPNRDGEESDQQRIDNDQETEEEDIDDEYENMVEGVEVNSQQNEEEEEYMLEVEREEDHDGGIRTYNNYKTVSGEHKIHITAIKNNLSESVKTDMGKSLSLDKESNQSDQNDFRSYYKDGGTQTKSQNLPRTIFNTDWTAEASFGVRGGELQTANSSVKLIVTPDTVKESEFITINAHVHVNIKKLTEVLEIPKDEFIVSPAPEYHLNADWKKVIQKPMIIQLPVILPATFVTENLRVYVFQSKAGLVVKYPIGEKSKQNDNNVDSYFDVSEDRKNILIYTYHFSGVVACSKCSTDVVVPGYLNACIFGSNKLQKHRHRRDVRIRYEIFAENEIKDFEAQIHPVHIGLVPIEKKLRISLPAKVDNDSKMIIKLVVIGDESNLWECKKLPTGEEIFPLEKEVYIKDLITCSAHLDSFYTDFVMCGTPESTDEPLQPFECVINVYEKDVNGTEGAVAISSSNNKSYVKLSDQLEIEAAWGSMGEMLQANKNRNEKRTANNPEQEVYVTQKSQTRAQPIAQPHTDSLEIRSDNRSMAELNNRELFRCGIQEVGLPPGISRQASHKEDVGEGTEGPQAMAELHLNQTDHRSPCENSDINEYPAHPDPDQDQTVPKDTDVSGASTILSFDK